MTLSPAKAVQAERRVARGAAWEEAIRRHAGNIARAAKEAGFSRQHGYALTRRYGLVWFAMKLRLDAGQPARGRPRQ